MCHGAGGMAGHVRFGARTGGALIILGGLICGRRILFQQFSGNNLQDIPCADSRGNPVSDRRSARARFV